MKKLKVEIDGNDTLSIEHKEEIKIIFNKSMDLLNNNEYCIEPPGLINIEWASYICCLKAGIPSGNIIHLASHLLEKK